MHAYCCAPRVIARQHGEPFVVVCVITSPRWKWFVALATVASPNIEEALLLVLHSLATLFRAAPHWCTEDLMKWSALQGWTCFAFRDAVRKTLLVSKLPQLWPQDINGDVFFIGRWYFPIWVVSLWILQMTSTCFSWLTKWTPTKSHLNFPPATFCRTHWVSLSSRVCVLMSNCIEQVHFTVYIYFFFLTKVNSHFNRVWNEEKTIFWSTLGISAILIPQNVVNTVGWKETQGWRTWKATSASSRCCVTSEEMRNRQQTCTVC